MFSLTKNSGILSCRRSFPKDLMSSSQRKPKRKGSGRVPGIVEGEGLNAATRLDILALADLAQAGSVYPRR